MRLKLLLLVLLANFIQIVLFAQDASNKRYPYDSANQSVPDSLKGEVLQFTFNHSKLYPGTSRTYWVYIPKALQSCKACLSLRVYGWRSLQCTCCF